MIEYHFPVLFRDADELSKSNQRSYVRLTAAGLLTALIAAIGGAIPIQIKLGGHRLHIAAAIAGLAFIIGIGVSLWVITMKPERGWYEGRAAAESIKTLSWQYSVGGGIFGLDCASDPDPLFVLRLSEITASLRIGLTGPIGGSQISQEMKHLRAGTLTARRDAYISERLDDQSRWYSKNASHNQKRVRLWLAATMILQGVGVIGAALRVFGTIEVDVLGIAATAAAGASAWLQTKDHQNLAESYSITARELALIRTRADTLANSVSETDWASFVHDAEQAISREHTLWLARRGAPA